MMRKSSEHHAGHSDHGKAEDDIACVVRLVRPASGERHGSHSQYRCRSARTARARPPDPRGSTTGCGRSCRLPRPGSSQIDHPQIRQCGRHDLCQRLTVPSRRRENLERQGHRRGGGNIAVVEPRFLGHIPAKDHRNAHGTVIPIDHERNLGARATLSRASRRASTVLCDSAGTPLIPTAKRHGVGSDGTETPLTGCDERAAQTRSMTSRHLMPVCRCHYVIRPGRHLTKPRCNRWHPESFLSLKCLQHLSLGSSPIAEVF